MAGPTRAPKLDVPFPVGPPSTFWSLVLIPLLRLSSGPPASGAPSPSILSPLGSAGLSSLLGCAFCAALEHALYLETVWAFGSWRLLYDARWALWVPTASSGCHFGARWDCPGLWPCDVPSCTPIGTSDSLWCVLLPSWGLGPPSLNFSKDPVVTAFRLVCPRLVHKSLSRMGRFLWII